MMMIVVLVSGCSIERQGSIVLGGDGGERVLPEHSVDGVRLEAESENRVGGPLGRYLTIQRQNDFDENRYRYDTSKCRKFKMQRWSKDSYEYYQKNAAKIRCF